MKTILVGLTLSVAAAASGQTSMLQGAAPKQLFDVLGGPPYEAHRADSSLADEFLKHLRPRTINDVKQILKTSDGDWYYVDSTQPCHLTEVKFVFRGGRVESWTRFVPVTIAGGPQGRVAAGSEPPPVLTEQELITRIKASRLNSRMSPFRNQINWLECLVGIVTDPS